MLLDVWDWEMSGSSMATPNWRIEISGWDDDSDVRAVSLSEFAGACSSYLLKSRWLEVTVPGSVISAGLVIAVLAVICKDLTVDPSATGT